jgi:hypothetical protein
MPIIIECAPSIPCIKMKLQLNPQFSMLPLYKSYNPGDNIKHIRICEVGKDEQMRKELDSSRPQWIDVEPKNSV